jgi:hypothetical protein
MDVEEIGAMGELRAIKAAIIDNNRIKAMREAIDH